MEMRVAPESREFATISQDGLLDRARIGIAKVFQEVKQIDAGFAYRGLVRLH